MTTRREVSLHFNIPLINVEQLGGKQLFLVDLGIETYLVSYLTKVGKYNRSNGLWELTDQRYSKTTSLHLAYFKKEYIHYDVVEGEIV